MKNLFRKTVCILLTALLLLPVLPVAAQTQFALTLCFTDLNGNESESVVRYTAGEQIRYPDYKSDKTQTFSGWQLSDGSAAPDTMPANDLTVYSSLQWVEYTVTYTLQDGPWETQAQVYHYGDALNPPEILLEDGQGFSGWTTVDGAAPDVVISDLSLFGKVFAEQYTLTYVVNGEEMPSLAQTYFFNDDIHYHSDYDNITGHSFTGWFTDGNFTEKAPDTMPANDLTVYGNTSKNSYTVSYYINGTKLTTQHTLFYGDAITPLTSYDNIAGYTFSGWHMADGSQYPATMPDRDIALYAEQTANEYALNYYLNGQFLTTQMYTYNEPISYITDYDNVTGSVFSGWKLPTGEPLPQNMPAQSLTVYGTQTQQAQAHIIGGTYEEILQGESFEVLLSVEAPYLQTLTVSDIAFDEDIFMLTDIRWLTSQGEAAVDLAGRTASLQATENINLNDAAVLCLSFTVNTAAAVGKTGITFEAAASSLTEGGSKTIETVVSPASVQVICGVHDFTGTVTALHNGTHSVACKNGCGESINESCFGGTATCLAKAKCTVCNSEYGFRKAHDYTGEPRCNNDGTHSYKCVNGCDAFGGTYACNFGFATSNGDNLTHTVTCTVCANTKTENCYGGTATCLEKATCDACKTLYGECKEHSYTGQAFSVGGGRHTLQCVNGCGAYGNETDCVFTYTADYDEKHIKTCTLCGYEVAEYCSGGKATCENRPTCEYCGSAYGQKLSHSYTGESISNKNGSHKRRCINGCGQLGGDESCTYGQAVSKGNNTSHEISCTLCGYAKTQPCSGGTASCSSRAVCSECGGFYGNTAEHSFTGDFVYNGDGTHSCLCVFGCGEKGEKQTCSMSEWTSVGDGTHKRSCTVCLREETQSCSGGDAATCDKKSVCEVCNSPYGDTLPHTFDDSCTPDKEGTHIRYCIACKQNVTENCTSDTPATCSSRAICKFCAQPFGELAPHTYTYEPDANTAGQHNMLCTACAYADTDACSGGTASCIAPANCEFCGRAYGEPAEHRYDGIAQPAGDGTHKLLCSMGCGEYGEAIACTFAEYTSNGDNTHTAICTVCKQKQTLPCSGGKEVCGESAICAFCNASYGNFREHNYTVLYDGIHHWGECTHCHTKTALEPHTYTEWIVTAQADYTQDGAQWRLCTTCGRINSVTVHLLGDLDGSLDLSAADARIALRASVGLQTLSDEQTENGDIDRNGKIEASDARDILRACVGLSKEKMIFFKAAEE